MPAGKGQRRLLLIETEIDLTMLDLDRAFEASPPPEITVPLTSGATADACTKVLLRAGALRIDVLVLARVVETV